MVLEFSVTDLLAIAILAIVGGAVVALYLWWIGWAISKKPETGVESLLGRRGTATTDVTLSVGEVNVDGIVWKARLYDEKGKSHERSEESKRISKGDFVVVVGVSSLTLIVKKQDEKV